MEREEDSMDPMLYGASLVTQSLVSVINTSRNIKNQQELAKKNQQLQLMLESNRENFQREMFEKSVWLQKEITRLGHEYRLLEQEQNFDSLTKQAEWQYFLQQCWPLIVPPFVVRREALVKGTSQFSEDWLEGNDTRVALRVLVTKSTSDIYRKYVEDIVNEGLYQFINKNYSQQSGQPVIFYGGGWKSTHEGGGAANENLYYALKGLPTLIISPKVVHETLYFNVAFWGFGNDSIYQDKLFSIPFKKAIVDNRLDEGYYLNFAEELQAYFNYIVGWIADMYYFIEYNSAPILPRIIGDQLNDSRFEGLKDYLMSQYKELYKLILDSSNPHNCFTRLKKEKTCFLPELCLQFGESVGVLVDREWLRKSINDSLKYWGELRGLEGSGEYSLDDLRPYFTKNDLAYIEQLKGCYRLIEDYAAVDCLNSISNNLSCPQISCASNSSKEVKKKVVSNEKVCDSGEMTGNGEEDIFNLTTAKDSYSGGNAVSKKDVFSI
ncbi:MAG: hypothetical protein N3B21_08715 [Clostridia bacterium]|nr:hypothetical protein [Clostridia bacterium]